MKIGLLTDAPKHNLALMKLSAYHKKCGDEIIFNMPLWRCDYTYASVLFEKNKNLFKADEYGGPAFNGEPTLNCMVEDQKPDYDLYGLDYSLGYTYRSCHRGCSFCKVTLMERYDNKHYSIWSFYNPQFKKICLLNNNTFMDKRWRETFEEIWDAGLTVIDENGYDLRLLDEERADALKRTRFHGKIHFAWDRMQDESQIIRGLKILNHYKIKNTHIYILIGYDTTFEEDMYRCQKIIDYGHDPYIMPYNQSKDEKRFKRFIDTFMWRKYKTLNEAWENYNCS